MTIVIAIVVLVIVLVVPVMVGARVVGARNTGFGSALLAVIVLAIVSAGVDSLVADEIVTFLVNATVGAIVLAGVLGTTFLRGLAVGIIAAIIQFVVMLVLASLAIGTGSM